MKGQYRIISELILFGIGIMLATYVVINFNAVKENVKTVSLVDQMNGVADSVAVALVKAYSTENSSMVIKIPTELSEEAYKISIKDVDGGKIVVNTLDNLVFVEKQLFNINYDNIVESNNIINNSEVVSSAGLLEIAKNEKITIRRPATVS